MDDRNDRSRTHAYRTEYILLNCNVEYRRQDPVFTRTGVAHKNERLSSQVRVGTIRLTVFSVLKLS